MLRGRRSWRALLTRKGTGLIASSAISGSAPRQWTAPLRRDVRPSPYPSTRSCMLPGLPSGRNGVAGDRGALSERRKATS